MSHSRSELLLPACIKCYWRKPNALQPCQRGHFSHGIFPSSPPASLALGRARSTWAVFVYDQKDRNQKHGGSGWWNLARAAAEMNGLPTRAECQVRHPGCPNSRRFKSRHREQLQKDRRAPRCPVVFPFQGPIVTCSTNAEAANLQVISGDLLRLQLISSSPGGNNCFGLWSLWH